MKIRAAGGIYFNREAMKRYFEAYEKHMGHAFSDP